MLNLEKSRLLGEGNERQCFSFPNKDNLCIKINKKNIVHRNQNTLELTYLRSLLKRKVPFTYIAKLYGSVETNRGKGLVYERVQNFDGTPSVTITDAIKNNIISKTTLDNLLKDVFNYLIDNWISLGDINEDQMLLKIDENSNYKLIIIDGLGTRRSGIKLFLVMISPFLARRKTKKGWNKLLNKIAEKNIV